MFSLSSVWMNEWWVNAKMDICQFEGMIFQKSASVAWNNAISMKIRSLSQPNADALNSGGPTEIWEEALLQFDPNGGLSFIFFLCFSYRSRQRFGSRWTCLPRLEGVCPAQATMNYCYRTRVSNVWNMKGWVRLLPVPPASFFSNFDLRKIPGIEGLVILPLVS